MLPTSFFSSSVTHLFDLRRDRLPLAQLAGFLARFCNRRLGARDLLVEAAHLRQKLGFALAEDRGLQRDIVGAEFGRHDQRVALVALGFRLVTCLLSCVVSAVAKVGSSRASTWPFLTSCPTSTSIDRTIDVSSGCTTKVGSTEITFPVAVTIRSICATELNNSTSATMPVQA